MISDSSPLLLGQASLKNVLNFMPIFLAFPLFVFLQRKISMSASRAFWP